MLRPSRYILIPAPQRVGLGIVGTRFLWVLIAKWRPSQHQYKKYHRYGGKTALIPLKNTIKKFLKTSKNKKKPSRL
jgi:hypothetical protein